MKMTSPNVALYDEVEARRSRPIDGASGSVCRHRVSDPLVIDKRNRDIQFQAATQGGKNAPLTDVGISRRRDGGAIAVLGRPLAVENPVGRIDPFLPQGA